MINANSPEDAIRSLIENWVQAVQAKNLEGAVAHHASNIVMFDVPLPLQSKGLEEYKKTWELFFKNSPGGSESFKLAELTVTASDAVAFAHALLYISSKEPVGRLTMGLHKENGAWHIVHEHHSYPLEI